MLNGPAFEAYCTSLETDVGGMLWLKRDTFLFAIPDAFGDRIASLPIGLETRHKVRTHLANALAISRSVESLDARPHYAHIVEHLMAAVKLVSPGEPH